jgi:tetratricopeptide (TPR) repeat protein
MTAPAESLNLLKTMCRSWLGVAWIASALVYAGSIVAADATAAKLRSDARAQRDRGDFKTAIASLESLVSSGEATLDDELMLAETLGWEKLFGPAEKRYRSILQRQPSSAAARLGLARVLLWTRRYSEARSEFMFLDTLDGLEGRATAAYWQGDYRTAARELRQILDRDGNREFARRSLAEIAGVMRPTQALRVTATRDDQPFETTLAEVTALQFVTPLDHWFVSAGRWRLHRPVDDRITAAPRLLLGYERVFPWQRLTVSASAGAVRLPGNDTEPIGTLSATLRAGTSRFSAAISQREILTNPAEKYGTVRSTSLQWLYEKNGRAAAFDLEDLAYFDRNRGVLASAYGIVPVIQRDNLSAWIGLSASYRNTQENRFYATTVNSSRRPDNAFNYTYRGLYLPYWSPRDLREGRLIAGTRVTLPRRASLQVQIDGGEARDRAPLLGPFEGPDPLPATIFTFAFDRRYQPYHGRADLRVSLGAGFSVEAAYEHNSTVDYRSNIIHAALVRRR